MYQAETRRSLQGILQPHEHSGSGSCMRRSVRLVRPTDCMRALCHEFLVFCFRHWIDL